MKHTQTPNYITFRPQTKQQRFDGAIIVLKQFYDFLLTQRHNVGYNVHDTTTNNYETFINNVTRDGVITISQTGSNFTIYDSVHYNTLARYHHDLIHYNYRLDFTPQMERVVAQIQIKEINDFMDYNGTSTQTQMDVLEIIYYDIVSQVEYYDTFKKFVINQKKFVYDLFLNGGDIKIETFSDIAYLKGVDIGITGIYIDGVLAEGSHNDNDTNLNIIKHKTGGLK